MPATPDSGLLIRRLPKLDLHLHLEGSIEAATLREMARRKGRLVKESEDWIADREREGFRYPKFSDFLNAFKLLSLLLETPEDYALATTRLVESLHKEGVRYAEVTLSAGVVLWKKQSLDAVFEAVRRAAGDASARLGVGVAWIFDAIRQFGPDHVRAVMQHAARFLDQGVVAFGIGGDEARGPARLFADIYREARDRGLHLTAHAGEAAGAQSVRDAVELLGAERIGHGTSAGRDPATLQLLAERRVPVEVCLTSNIATGAVQRIEDHPLRRFLAAGVPVTLSSDDPGMFATSITHEMLLAAEHFALSRDEIIGLSANAIHAAFLPENDRGALRAGLDRARDEMAAAAQA
ncbi:MAG TPA: adenosine deaminase [Terriglobia bacterium]|nr:adenosine deaminase [Terriglobia bacterium]